MSQRHAGWIALASMYDDGGLSGGTMERPALKRLLGDIEASKVQTVVVYKVDRLTPSDTATMSRRRFWPVKRLAGLRPEIRAARP